MEHIAEDEVMEDEVFDIFEDPRGAQYKDILNEFSMQCAGRDAVYSKLRLQRGWAAIAAVRFSVQDQNSMDILRPVQIAAVSKGSTAESLELPAQHSTAYHSIACHVKAVLLAVQKAESNAAECVMRKLRRGRVDEGDLGIGPLVGPLGQREEVVSKHIIRAKFGSDHSYRQGNQDVDSWQILDLMYSFSGERGRNSESQLNLVKFKPVFKVTPILASKQHLSEVLQSLQDPRSAQERQCGMLELYRKGLYAKLEVNPLYVPDISLTLYWPDNRKATVPCMVALASTAERVVLDLCPLGRSMAAEEGQPSEIPYSDACKKALGLLQMVLDDNINIITWDRGELLCAKKLLSAGVTKQLNLSNVGQTLKGLAESMELSFKETLDEGLPQLEGIVTHLTILHETFPRFQHNWGDEHQAALSLPTRKFGALEAATLLRVFNRLRKFKEAERADRWQKVPARVADFTGSMRKKLEDRVSSENYEFTPAQGGVDGGEESQGSLRPSDDSGGAADAHAGPRRTDGFVSPAPQAGGRLKRGRPGDVRGQVSNVSRQGPESGAHACDAEEVEQPLRGREAGPQHGRDLPAQAVVDVFSMPGVVNAAPVEESGPARKQRLADERNREVERLEELEKDQPARRGNVDAMKTDSTGRIISGFPVKAKKNKGKKKREAAQRAAAFGGPPHQSTPGGGTQGGTQGGDPSGPELSMPVYFPDGPDGKPYRPRWENMTQWEIMRNTQPRKAYPKFRRKKKRKGEDEELKPPSEQQQQQQQQQQECNEWVASTSHRCKTEPSHEGGRGEGRDVAPYSAQAPAVPLGQCMCEQPEEVEAGEMIDPERQRQIEAAQQRKQEEAEQLRVQRQEEARRQKKSDEEKMQEEKKRRALEQKAVEECRRKEENEKRRQEKVKKQEKLRLEEEKKKQRDSLFRRGRLQQLKGGTTDHMQPSPAPAAAPNHLQPSNAHHSPPPSVTAAQHNHLQTQPGMQAMQAAGTSARHQMAGPTVTPAAAYAQAPAGGAPAVRQHASQQQPRPVHAWGEPVQKPVPQHVAPAPPGLPEQQATHWQQVQQGQQPHPHAQQPPSLQRMRQPGSQPPMQYAPLVQHERGKQAPIHATPSTRAPVPQTVVSNMPPAASLGPPGLGSSAPVTSGSMGSQPHSSASTKVHAPQQGVQMQAEPRAAPQGHQSIGSEPWFSFGQLKPSAQSFVSFFKRNTWGPRGRK